MNGGINITIDFNYAKAIGQADQIDEIAGDMRDIANNQFQNSLNALNQMWRGDASTLFIALCNQTKSDILAQVKHLQDLACTIRQISKIIREAEEQAKLAESQNVQK